MKSLLQKASALLVIFLMTMTTVAAADITLTYPTEDDYVGASGSVTINWTQGDTCGAGTDAVNIYYKDSIMGSYTLLTTSPDASDLNFTWSTVSLEDELSPYKIKLTSTCNSPDEVSGPFILDNTDPTITTGETGSDTLLDPNGGELMAGGDVFEILWDDEDITDDNLGSTPISLWLSLDGGDTWEEDSIAEDEANDGSYMWTVPEVDTTEALVKLVATDLAGNSASDTSDAVFTIDSTEPTADVSYSDTEISESDDEEFLSIILSYDEEMDTSVEPMISFDPDMSETFTACDGEWFSPAEYEYICTIVDADEEEEVDVTVSGAEDLAGNAQNILTEEDALWVDTIHPEVEDITADPDPTPGDVEITVDFTEDMDTEGSPDVYLSLDGDDSIYSSNDDGYWLDDDTWVESFEFVSGDSFEGDLVDVSVSDAEDLIGNDLETGEGSFVLDNVAPSGYTASFDDDFIGEADATSTSFSFEDAEVGATYYYSIDDTEGMTSPVTGLGTVETSSDTVEGIDVSSLADGVLGLEFWLVDEATNLGSTVNDETLKDTGAPSIVEITTSEDEEDMILDANDGVISESDVTTDPEDGPFFWVAVTYDEEMDTESTPSVSFDPSLEDELTDCLGGWTVDAMTYIYACSVVDTDAEIDDVDISVSGGDDLFGNTMEGEETREDAFDVDLLQPWVTNVEVYPIPAVEGPVVLNLTFSEDMDMDVPLNVSIQGLSTTYTVSGDFTNGTTWVGSFDLEDDDEELLAYVYVEEGEDEAGNIIDTNIWSFSINTVNFYMLDIPGNDIGFTSAHPGFWLSLNQLEATNLEDFEVNTVLDATAGPLDERLVHGDVSMVWAYDVATELWASYDVVDGTGDFTDFGWTDSPAWYELDLEDSGQYKSIRHDDGEDIEEPAQIAEE